MAVIKISAAGDSFVTQPVQHNQKWEELRDFFCGHDARFTNLEIVLHDFEVYPAPLSGGSWASARPEILNEFKDIGMNLLGCANNHSFDWNIGGVLKTMQHVREYGIVHAELGRNLAEAAQPCYLNTPHGRIAMISVTSTCPVWGMASQQRPDVLGRPGANVLRYEAVHKVLPEQLEALRTITEKTEVNADRLLNEKEGFAKPAEGGFYVGNIRFEADSRPHTVTRMNQDDADRIVKSIKEARRQADIVMVSIHGHERKGLDKTLPPDFIKDFAHLCIDSGARLFVGHGPHIWRGVEVYKNCPIFYSLGNFIFQSDSTERQPTEFYDLYNLGPDNTVSDGLEKRSLNETRGLAADPRVYESAVISVTAENGEILSADIHPITLGFHKNRPSKGLPELASGEAAESVLQHIRDLSGPYGTVIDVKNGTGSVRLR